MWAKGAQGASACQNRKLPRRPVPAFLTSAPSLVQHNMLPGHRACAVQCCMRVLLQGHTSYQPAGWDKSKLIATVIAMPVRCRLAVTVKPSYRRWAGRRAPGTRPGAAGWPPGCQRCDRLQGGLQSAGGCRWPPLCRPGWRAPHWLAAGLACAGAKLGTGSRPQRAARPDLGFGVQVEGRRTLVRPMLSARFMGVHLEAAYVRRRCRTCKSLPDFCRDVPGLVEIWGLRQPALHEHWAPALRCDLQLLAGARHGHHCMGPQSFSSMIWADRSVSDTTYNPGGVQPLPP